MRVTVGSTNPVKILATQNAFSKYYSDASVEGVKVSTSVSPQPVGIEETVRGAVERSKEASRLVSDSDFTVGIEAGLIPIPCTLTGYVDQQVAAIMDRDGVLTIGASPAFEYPPVIVRSVLDNRTEINHEMEKLTGIRSIGRKQGAIGFLSKGEVERAKLTEQAVLMALIPRINVELYFKKQGTPRRDSPGGSTSGSS